MDIMASDDDNDSADDNNNVDVCAQAHSKDLEWKIQAAGRMYQSIKAMRRQNEQQQKKRLLRRRMRSLEHQQSWRKTSMNNLRNTSIDTSSIVGDGPDTPTVVGEKSGGADSEPDHDIDALNSSLLSEDSTVTSEGADLSKFRQQEEELLQLCEEQQDLLDRLVLHQQNERDSWDRIRQEFQAERDSLLKDRERKQWNTPIDPIVENDLNENTKEKGEVNLPPPTDEVQEVTADSRVVTRTGELEDEIESLKSLLATEEGLRRRQEEEHRVKNQVAYRALETAMHRFESLQELAIHLKSMVANSQKAKIAELKG